ncbi:MAG: SDR family oxidoreductase [Leptospirales bacterium]|nr:SDR family oxidoreductase [Leptospirales bacterium]
MSIVGLIRGKGASGFGYNSTAEEVTEGLDLKGKTYLVTGANSGLGLETTRVLASRGARILAAARTAEKAREATARFGDVRPLECELSSLASVRACVDTVKREGVSLDGIICNAGIMALPRLQTTHGLELQFFTNHIGHFILVTGLLDTLTASGRVVMLSSDLHKSAPDVGIEFDNLSGAKGYNPWKAYGQSKLANLLFARALARRLKGTGKTANALHPGVIVTNLSRSIPAVARGAMSIISPLVLKSVGQGAATQCYVATNQTLGGVSGEYFADCNVARSSPISYDTDLAERLWVESERIVAGLN